jgi:hypothetical protein
MRRPNAVRVLPPARYVTAKSKKQIPHTARKRHERIRDDTRGGVRHRQAAGKGAAAYAMKKLASEGRRYVGGRQPEGRRCDNTRLILFG